MTQSAIPVGREGGWNRTQPFAKLRPPPPARDVANCDGDPAVIIPVLTQHYPMLQRNLLYTGVTRGKRLVVLVGQKKAVAIAVRNVSGRRRWSKLGEWLRPVPPASRPTGMAG